MDIINAIQIVFDYVRRDENDKIVEKTRAVDNLDLKISAGDFVCVLGHNGSGKSTLAKLINGLQLPTEGTMYVSGKNTADENLIWDIRKEAGMVFQNPDNQIIASVVEEDVGFGPENIGVPTEEIWKRVDQALAAVDMEAYRLKSPNRLSGGQKQRVAIAGTMAMRPNCIILDEPTAMLDPNGRKEVIQTIRELNKTAGVTIILITHYMEEAVDADRIIVMDKGRMVMDGTPREVFSRVQELKAIRMDVPEITELAWRLQNNGLPIRGTVLTIEELVEQLKEILPQQAVFEPEFVKKAPQHLEISDPVIRIRHLSHVYQKDTAMESHALKDISFDIERGSVTAFIGHTGSGKSTLVQHLNGILKGTDGEILVRFRDDRALYRYDVKPEKKLKADEEGFLNIQDPGFNMKQLRFKVGLVFQYPEYQLFEVDVLNDVMFGPKNQGLTEKEARQKAESALRLVGLGEENWQKSPFELSGGQKRRAAIAGVLAMEPEVLILDEPTAGLDPAGRDDLFREILGLHEKTGMTIILVSHSMDDVARFADHAAVLEKGELRMYGTPEEVFRRYQELEKMGLGAPQMTNLIHALKDAGIRFYERPDTVDEMCECISDLYNRWQKATGKEVEHA